MVVLSEKGASLCHLGGDTDRALTELDALIEDVEQADLPVLDIKLRDNRSVVRHEALTADEDFYERADRRRMRGIKTWDAEKVLGAIIDAEGGRHFDALPAIWTQVCWTYQRLSWQGHRWAHQRLAMEYLEVGYLSNALWHALCARDQELIKKVATRQQIADVLEVIFDALRWAEARKQTE